MNAVNISVRVVEGLLAVAASVASLLVVQLALLA